MSSFNEAEQEAYREVVEEVSRKLSSGALQPDESILHEIDHAVTVTEKLPDLPDKQTDPEGNAKAYERRMKVADAVFRKLRVKHNLPLCRTALVEFASGPESSI